MIVREDKRSLLLKHDIHIKPKSYKFELLGELAFNMVPELGLARGPGFESFPCNLFGHLTLIYQTDNQMHRNQESMNQESVQDRQRHYRSGQ